jgi:hypothetical protein
LAIVLSVLLCEGSDYLLAIVLSILLCEGSDQWPKGNQNPHIKG